MNITLHFCLNDFERNRFVTYEIEMLEIYYVLSLRLISNTQNEKYNNFIQVHLKTR